MKKLGLLIVALLFSSNLYAVDSVSVAYGDGSGYPADMMHIGVGWDWDSRWFDEGDWLVTGYWEATAASWRSRSVIYSNRSITDIGFTPVFRLQQRNPSAIAPYFEGAIGFHLISPTSISDGRRFGSAFQFGDHVGVGVRFGEQHQYDLSLRYQHLSNADIKQPNQGIDFNQLRFAYHF